ncbi:MAG TPA: hypothetical protein VK668_10305 [Mucilaginibacter sp.]|nr:hypothetical protein [Mucilaginibacter sp.]
MNHTAENALIVGAFLTTILLPVYLVIRQSSKKRKAKLTERLNTVINDHNLSLTRSEQIGNKMIGWDQPNKILVLADNNQPEVEVNDLKQASKCYVLRNMSGNSVRSIFLQIVDPHNKLLCSIPCYEQFVDNEMKLKRVDQQVRDWEQLLNAHLVK